MGDPGHVRTFNRIAPRYDDKFGKDCEVAHDAVLEWAAEAGLTPRTVLDLGCGTGKLLARAGTVWPGAHLIGVDPADRMVELARARLPGADLTVGTAESLRLPDASADLAVSTTSFGHWTDPVAGLAETRRVLRPGGALLLAEHAPPGLLMGTLLRVMGRLPRLFDVPGLRGLLRDGGWTVARAEVIPGAFVVVHAVKP